MYRTWRQTRENLSVFVGMMKDEWLKVASFVVEGHAVSCIGDACNVEISEAWTTSLRDGLASFRVSPERLAAVGFAKGRPRRGDEYETENRNVKLRVDLR